MLDIAKSVSSQVSRIFKLQEKEVIFYEAQSIERSSSTDRKSQKNNFYKILNQAQARINV